jgi:hypothetical protein
MQMGYQESLVAVRPPEYFHRVVKLCEKQRQSGFYDQNLCTVEVRSVIVLKQRLGAFPAGTKLLWVTGDRCFHRFEGLLDQDKQISYSHIKLKFVPIERLIHAPDTTGIDFGDNAPPSENTLFKRYSPADFLKEREAEKGAR